MSDVIERIKDRMIKRQEAMEQDSYSTENKARILESKATLIIIDQEMAKEPHAQPIVRTAEEIVKRQVCDSCSACTGCYEEDKQLCEYAKEFYDWLTGKDELDDKTFVISVKTEV